jgi:hypothetical protein
MRELEWDWAKIASTLLWKLAPGGVVLFPHELAALPHDRVLLEERLPDRINLTFITLEEAHSRTHAANPQMRATTDKMTGRWRQIACVLLWKLAKKGVTIAEYDANAVPSDLILMTAGHALGVEWQFIPRAQAAKERLLAFEREGKDIMERI